MRAYVVSSTGRTADGLAFLTDRRRGDDRWLEWKIRLFSVAAVLALAGIYLEERWMTGAAIVMLGAGIGLRGLSGRDETAEDPHSDDQHSNDLNDAVEASTETGRETRSNEAT